MVIDSDSQGQQSFKPEEVDELEAALNLLPMVILFLHRRDQGFSEDGSISRELYNFIRFYQLSKATHELRLLKASFIMGLIRGYREEAQKMLKGALNLSPEDRLHLLEELKLINERVAQLSELMQMIDRENPFGILTYGDGIKI